LSFHHTEETSQIKGPPQSDHVEALRVDLRSALLQFGGMVDAFLVPPKTTVSARGDGAAVDVSTAGTRVFLLTLNITNIIEQESLDVSVYGSSDGTNWGKKPIVAFPQKFYRGEHPLLLDLTQQSDVTFVRAHWEVNRWGRGSETPMFEFSLAIKEVPAEILKEAAAEELK
jgi:hypothetical protein